MIGVRLTAYDDARCAACFKPSHIQVQILPRNGVRQTFTLCSSCSRDLRDHLAAFDVRSKA